MTAWIDIDGPRGRERRMLAPGLTLLGGARPTIPVPEAPEDCVHLWDSPPKIIFVGRGAAPRLGGRAVDEAPLAAGDRFEWHGTQYTFDFDDGQAALEELPDLAAASATDGPVAWRRVKAGLAVELGAADKGVAKRWQDAVVRGEFEPEACTRDLLGSGAPLPDDDPRLVERGGRLLRDLLMTPTMRGARGASRQVRAAARGGFAFAVSQFIVLSIYSLMILIALLMVRIKWQFSFDEFLDNLRDVF